MNQNSKKIMEIVAKNGEEARIAGGAVRDFLLNKTPKDIDFATTADPSKIIEVFRKEGYEVVETGLHHGTVSVIMDHTPYEITTLRVDKQTDGRHATVEFTTDWNLDASRRDFTFNAMYMDIDGKIYDFFDGKSDLEQKVIQFIGNAEDRIKEDYLRIMRYFRFLSQLNFKPFGPELDDIEKHVEGLKQISEERIFTEVSKIISFKRSFPIHLMNEVNVSNTIFGMKLPITKMNVFFNNWEMILHSMGIGSEWFEKFKAPRKIIDRIKFMETFQIGEINYDTYVHGEELIREFATLNNIIGHYPICIPPFPLNGHDFMEAGYQGKEISVKKKQLEKLWAKSNFSLTKEDLKCRL